MNKRILWSLKCGLTVTLLALLFYNIDWSTFSASVRSVDLGLVIAVFLIAIINITISAWKWQILHAPFQVTLRLFTAVKIYFIGFFFNNFLPGSIGGDGYRAYRAYKIFDNKTAAFVPIFIERISGLVVLLLLGLVAGLVGYALTPLFGYLLGAIISGGLLVVVTACFVFLKFRAIIKKICDLTKLGFILKLLDKLAVGIATYKSHTPAIAMALGISLLFYCLLFLSRDMLLNAVNAEIPILALVVVIVVSNAAAMMPVSINGYGVLDLSFVYFVTYFGVQYEDAVLVMLLHRVILIAASALGGFVYLASGTERYANDVELDAR